MSKIDKLLASMPKGLRKAYQKGSDVHLEVFATASVGLNRALGGGFGRNRLALVYGQPSAGKSLLLLDTIALQQKLDPEFTVAWVDTESSWDAEWSARVGIDNERVILIQKKSAAAIADAINPLVQEGIDMLIVDSISQIMPESFIDGGHMAEFDKQKQIGQLAKSITMLVNGINYSNHRTAVILLSQVSLKFNTWGVSHEPHGGEKVKFASSQMVKLVSDKQTEKQIKGEFYVGDKIFEYPIGRNVRAVVEKNKLAPPNRSASYDLYYDGDFIGVDAVGETTDLAIELGIISKGGAWLSYDGQQIQGRAKLIAKLREDQGLYEKILKEVENA